MAAQLADNSDAYWLDRSYLEELEDNPLDEGRKKTFRIDDGIIRSMDEDTHAVYREMWRIFSTVLEEDHLELFESVKFYNNPDDFFAALVYQTIEKRGNHEREEWELEINLANVRLDGSRRYNDAVETLTHEAAHMLLMNESQVEFFVDEDDCDTYFITGLESCAKDGSYYDALRTYWDDEFIEWGDNFLELFQAHPEEVEEELSDYYQEHEDEFVSQYAASGPDEDAAETIAHFARYRVPTGALDIYEEKILLMFDFEELVGVRERVQDLLR